MKTTGTLSLSHERVDDIPLLLGFMQQLNFPILLERHLGSHHLHRGLSNGWLATVWLAFLLSQSNHRKVSVEDWAGNHSHTLERLIGEPLRPAEFGEGVTAIPPSGGGLVEGRLFALDAVFDEAIPLAV